MTKAEADQISRTSDAEAQQRSIEQRGKEIEEKQPRSETSGEREAREEGEKKKYEERPGNNALPGVEEHR